MSSTDERVVSLKFDNQQFESGVKTSLGTLEKLKQGLKLEKSAKGLEGLKTASRGFSMDSVAGAVDAVTNKFSILGTIGDQVLRNLTNSALSLGKNLITAIPNQIIEGGKRRAQNIEQAMFQLRGLLGEDEFAKSQELINKNINDAVAGTAYGFDAAAKVASQLKASNIDFGEDMMKSLRGVSGVAAMTNSSYEEIGHIFTTVAGQGKLMTMQLNQLAGRGLNVAATLAKAYGVTEAELREMVTKGEVDFKSFAFAMDDAFGEHATKANETFSGALSNIKASLSRMGAKFATPIYDKLKEMFNKLLPIFKGVEKLLNPVAEAFEKILNTVSIPIGNALDSAKEALEGFLISAGLMDPVTKDAAKGVKDVANAVSKAGKTAEEVAEVVQKVINGDFGNGAARKKALEELGFSYAEVQNKVNELLGCSKRYEVEATEANEAVAESAEQAKNSVSDGADLFSQFAITVLGVVSAFKIVAKVGKEFVSKILIPVGKVLGGAVLKTLLSFTSKIGAKLIEINKNFEDNNSIEKFFDNLKDYLRTVKEFFSAVANSEGANNLAESLSNLWNVVKGTLGEALGFIIEQLEKLPGLFTSTFGEPSIERASGIVSDIADFLATIINLLSGGIVHVKNFFGAFEFKGINFDAIREFFVNLGNTEGVKRLGAALNSLKDTLITIAQSILGKVGQKLGEIPGLFGKIDTSSVSSTITSVLDKIAEGLGIVVELISGNLNAVKDFFGAFDIKADFASNFDALKTLFTTIAGVSTGKFKEVADGIKGIFSAGEDDSKVGVISGALASIGRLFDNIGGDPKDIKKKTAASANAVGEGLISGFASLDTNNILGGISKTFTGLGTVFSGILGKPEEIKAQASASMQSLGDGLLEGFSKINFDTVLKGVKVGALVYLILQVAGFFKSMKETSENISAFTKNISKIPKGASDLLDKLKDALTTYQKELRADALIKIAGAIAILALSLAVLAYVPSDQLANAAVDLALVVGVVALLVLAISKLMEKKPETTEKKENPLVDPLNKFLTGLNTAISNCLKTISKASAFLMVAAALSILIKTVTDLAQANISVDQATQAVAGLIGLSLLLVYLTFLMNQVASNFTMGSAASILAMAVAIKILADVVMVLGAIQNTDMLIQGLGGVVTLMSMFAIVGKSLGGANSNITKAAASILLITVALSLLVPVIILLGTLSKVATPGLVLVTILAGILVAVSAAASAIGTTFGKEGNAMFKGVAMMLALAGAIAVLAPALVLLGAVAKVAFKGIGVLAVAFAILLGAAAISAIPAVTVGLTAFTKAIQALGLAMLEAGVGVLAFSAGVAILVALAPVIFGAIKAMFVGIGNAISHLPEFAGRIISGIGQIFSAIWQAIVAYAPVLLDNLIHLIEQLPNWLVNTLPTIIAGLVALVVRIDIALLNLGAALFAAIYGILKGIVKGVVDGIAGAAGPIGNAIKRLLMAFINLIVDGLSGLLSKIPGSEWISDKLEGWRKGMAHKLRPSYASDTGKKFGDGLVKGTTVGLKGFSGVTGKIGKTAEKTNKELAKQGELGGEEWSHHLQKAVEDGRVDLEKKSSDVASGVMDAFTGADFDMSQVGEMFGGDLFEGFQNGTEGMSGNISELLGGEITEGVQGIDLSSIGTDLGGALPEGLGEGISGNIDMAIDPTQQMAEQIPEEFKGLLGINSPSKVFADLGQGIPEGTAKGITEGTPAVKMAMTTMVTQIINAIRPTLTQFTSMGRSMASNLASGLRSASSAVKSAASSLGSAAKSGVGDVYNAMRSKGRDAGQGYAQGILDKIPAIEAAARRASKAGIIKTQKTQNSGSPSKVYRKLGHDAMDGYVLGFKDRVKDIGSVATTASREGIDATKGALRHMADAISGSLDLDPTIKPVLDLTDIKNGAGLISSLLPNGSVGLGLAVAGNAPGATYRMTNEDVVSAINGLRNDLMNNPQTVNNYTMGDVSYDDGSNVATAVRSLIRAARTERRV